MFIVSKVFPISSVAVIVRPGGVIFCFVLYPCCVVVFGMVAVM